MELSIELGVERCHKIDLINAQVQLAVKHIIELKSGKCGLTKSRERLLRALYNS